MAKKIKKKIKHSLPGLLILILLSSVVAGFSFNLNLKLTAQKALANNDNATTQVTVRNAPPQFTGDAAENPISSSTSPRNNGSSIGFTAQAHDPEGNSFYLIICSSNAVTASSTGGAPTCGAITRCTSTITANDGTANCTYSGINNAAESEAWYAFVCDNHTAEGDCSAANQGSGDSGSPFYINHAPTFTAVNTTLDNRNPGQTFTMTATAFDTDAIDGTDDLLSLDICSTNAWATTTGCSAVTLCHATDTAVTDPTCTFATSTPASHGAFTYFAFVKDWHQMPASGNSQTNSYHVNDVSPVISNVVLTSLQGNSITVAMRGTASTTIYATSTSVTDNNGCSDLVGATSTIYYSNVANGPNCTGSYDNCYQMGASLCTLSDCNGGVDTQATYTCTTSISFHAIPTDAATNSPYTAFNWLARLAVYDQANSTTSMSSAVEVNTLQAFEVTQATIPYGTVKSSFDTGAFNATTTVVNYGNCPISSLIIGTDMTGPGTIEVWKQIYSTSTFTYGVAAGRYLTSTSSIDDAHLNCKKPTDAQVDQTDDIYWGIGIPSGKPSGLYSGTNTFTAILDPTNW
jgi:hypothetical protein